MIHMLTAPMITETKLTLRLQDKVLLVRGFSLRAALHAHIDVEHSSSDDAQEEEDGRTQN